MICTAFPVTWLLSTSLFSKKPERTQASMWSIDAAFDRESPGETMFCAFSTSVREVQNIGLLLTYFLKWLKWEWKALWKSKNSGLPQGNQCFYAQQTQQRQNTNLEKYSFWDMGLTFNCRLEFVELSMNSRTKASKCFSRMKNKMRSHQQSINQEQTFTSISVVEAFLSLWGSNMVKDAAHFSHKQSVVSSEGASIHSLQNNGWDSRKPKKWLYTEYWDTKKVGWSSFVEPSWKEAKKRGKEKLSKKMIEAEHR